MKITLVHLSSRRASGTLFNTKIPITIHLYQCSTLSLFLCRVLDEISRSIQGNMSWCMVFADDILVGETREGVNVS